MPSYIVKPGDTLLKIATSALGSAGKWRIIADINGIINPGRIRAGQRPKFSVTYNHLPESEAWQWDNED